MHHVVNITLTHVRVDGFPTKIVRERVRLMGRPLAVRYSLTKGSRTLKLASLTRFKGGYVSDTMDGFWTTVIGALNAHVEARREEVIHFVQQQG